MLLHVVAKARKLESLKHLVVVVGHGAQAVKDSLKDYCDIEFAYQEQQLGTGHALMQALPYCDEEEPTLVLLGDVPLISIPTLQTLILNSGEGLGLLTV